MATAGPAAGDSAWSDETPIKTRLAELQAKHPGWNIWLSRGERMVGATLRDPSAGVSRTMIENTFTQMDTALERERRAAARTATSHLAPLKPVG